MTPLGPRKGRSVRPQIVLLDIGLPGMSGHEVAEQLHRRPWFKGCLLVAVTGWVKKLIGRHHVRRASTTTSSSQ